MANTLTSLIPTLYAALDVVSREMVGFIPAVSRNTAEERASKGESILIPIVPAVSAADVTPGVNAPDTGDQIIGNVSMTISKSRMVPVRWNGEETKGLKNAGTFTSINQQRFEQAFRTLNNEIETDLASTYTDVSRAFGTAGTAPFGTADELDDVAEMLRILEDNGAPGGDLHLVLGSAAMVNMRGKQSILFKTNEAGTDQLLRDGIIGRLEGFNIHNSAQIVDHTKGTGTSFVTDGGEPVGETTIAVDTGTGTVIAGDVATFAGDTNKYIVSAALAAGTFDIGEPGLRETLGDTVALTVGADYTANMAFHRSAIQLITRAPALPEDGDSADDRFFITDPMTGLTFEISVYRQYRQVHFEVAIAWGFKLIKPEHAAILLG